MLDTVLRWLYNFVKTSKQTSRPIFIGINGPQGCGKSTLAQALVKRLPEMDLSGIAVSIDDFYLTRAQQIQTAQLYSKNPFLQQRGYPGTHDLLLGVKTLRALQCIKSEHPARIPVYDKSLHKGQGDRLPEEKWKIITEPIDLVLLEGWMLGFRPVKEEILQNEDLKLINGLLSDYQQWHQFLSGWIYLEPQDIQNIVDWRIEAEEKMKASGKSGMTQEETKNYIQKFLPAYEIYLPGLIRNPPSNDQSSFIRFTLSKNRHAIV